MVRVPGTTFTDEAPSREEKKLAFVLTEKNPHTGLDEIVEVTFDEKEASAFYHQNDRIVRDVRPFYIDQKGEAGDFYVCETLREIKGED